MMGKVYKAEYREIKGGTRQELKEKLAGEMHEMWGGWVLDLLEQGEWDGLDFKIPMRVIKSWERQMRTPWDCLPDGEQKADMEAAERVLRIVNEELGIID